MPQFDYAATLLGGLPSERCYMVGDNPLTDIAGANAAGWTSVLVKTGMYQDGDDHAAHVAVKDVSEAVAWICEQEGISL